MHAKNHITKKEMLSIAEKMALQKGHRWTAMRKEVMACLLAQTKPITAYQLLEKLAQHLQKTINPPSVYRALDALITLGVVVKIESLNAFVACTHPHHHHNHHHVFLICRQCGTADELVDQQMSKRLSADAKAQGFKIERQILELQGACQNCQN
jgi:Fur family zinc uptake transcriptional regulator